MLNAFRHHGRDHISDSALPSRPTLCSTPFGITAGITGHGGRVGIEPPVLNAFRHHGRDHMAGQCARCGTGCAQRLSASRPGSHARSIGWRSPRRAQRLSASRPGSLHGPARGDDVRCVLNAFRHHGRDHPRIAGRLVRMCGCSTPFGITAGITRCAHAIRCHSACAQRLSASRPGSPRRARSRCGTWGVLNAFRHHGRDHRRGAVRRDARRGAQRLSASRPGSHSDPPWGPGNQQVLNAFRHHGRDHRRRAGSAQAAGVVLNAFRHHGRDHLIAAGGRLDEPYVLNAFRHHGRDHTCARASRTRSGCAQRLSASRPGSPLLEDFNVGSGKVLNAFRHHGRDHQVGVGASGEGRSAQRLSASRPGSPIVPSFTTRFIIVLNAFRHHGRDHNQTSVRRLGAPWCSTPFGITAGITPTAHGFRHRNGMCSTPFGITAGITRPPGSRPRRAFVLNAFRHHGRDHDRRGGAAPLHMVVLNAFRHHGRDHGTGPLVEKGCYQCSTPFGITAGITWCSRPSRPARRTSAQRLSASRPGSLVLRCDARLGVQVLNAFRHHGRDHGLVDAMRDTGYLCSTPFGITAGITTKPDRSPAATWCSTPFGITAGITRHRIERTPSEPRAQRLSASRPGSLPRDRGPPAGAAGVLNAFRHHGRDHASSRSRVFS